MEHSKTDQAVGALYGLPLEDFVSARNHLADQLRKEGDAEAAKVVKGLGKPTFSAWVTNQTVRRAPALVRQLLQVTQTLAGAQRATGRGQDDQQRLQTAMAEQRQVMTELAEVTEAVLAETGQAGHAASRATLDQVRNNLRWGPLSPEARELFEAGRLVRDAPAPGFAALAEDPPPAAHAAAKHESAAKRTARPEPAPPPPPSRSKVRAVADAQRKASEQLASLRAELRGVRTDVARARQDADRADKAQKTKADRVRAAEGDLAVARLALESAEAARQTAADALAKHEQVARDLEGRISKEEQS